MRRSLDTLAILLVLVVAVVVIITWVLLEEVKHGYANRMDSDS